MPNKLMPEIMKLSVKERLALADAIYESFDAEVIALEEKRELARQRKEPVTMLPNQAAELRRLIKKYDGHPELLIPAEKVLAGMKPKKKRC